jgi:hypothetical protein
MQQDESLYSRIFEFIRDTPPTNGSTLKALYETVRYKFPTEDEEEMMVTRAAILHTLLYFGMTLTVTDNNQDHEAVKRMTDRSVTE